jgi:outer membrane protein assembly factor BamB
MSRLFFLSLPVLTLALAHSPAADWPRFRGPNGSGVAEGKLPAIDPQAPLWKVAIPGRGSGSPIVVAGKVYLQTASANGKTRTLLCLDAATGKTLWSKDATGTTAKTHAKNSLASGTPACDGETVLCVWWDGSGVALHAYDTGGKEKWQTSLGGYVSQHGPGMSPVVHEGLAFVNVDDDERAELVAIDVKTGDKKWVVDRRHHRACYSSPTLLKRGDRPVELLLGTTRAITSYDPATGKVNWQYDLTWPAGSMPLRVIAHPVYAGGLVIMSCGDGGGARYMVAVDPDKPKPAKAWELGRDVQYVPCVLVKSDPKAGDLLFWVNDPIAGGSAVCAEAKTGKALFNAQTTTKPSSSSPVMAGGEILTIADDGEFVVFKAETTYDDVRRGKLGQGVIASPALADGRLYVRGTTHLFCFGEK